MTGLAPFGYGQLTGIDISGEKPGLLPSPAWKEALQAAGGSGLVPRRDRQHRRRPGLPAGDAAAARAHRRGPGRARPQLPPAPGDRHARRRRPCEVRSRPIEENPVTGISAAGLDDGDQCHDRHHALHRIAAPAASPSRAPPTAPRGKTGTAQVYTVAQNAKYNAKTVAGTAARSCLVHRLRAGRGAAHRGRGAGGECRLRRRHRGAHRAQGDRRLPAAARRQAQAGNRARRRRQGRLEPPARQRRRAAATAMR